MWSFDFSICVHTWRLLFWQVKIQEYVLCWKPLEYHFFSSLFWIFLKNLVHMEHILFRLVWRPHLDSFSVQVYMCEKLYQQPVEENHLRWRYFWEIVILLACLVQDHIVRVLEKLESSLFQLNMLLSSWNSNLCIKFCSCVCVSFLYTLVINLSSSLVMSRSRNGNLRFFSSSIVK